MAKPKPKVSNPVDRFRGRDRMRHARFDWARIKTDYVTSSLTRKELARKWGCSKSSLDTVIAQQGWVDQRQEFRRTIAERLQETAAEEVLEKKREAIRMIYGLKLQIIQKLQQRLQRGYLPKVRELDILQRLEMDLRAPGWSRSAAEAEGQTVNVHLQIESVIDGLNAERRKALESVEVRGGMNPAIAGFLYSGEEHESAGETESGDTETDDAVRDEHP